VPAGGSISAAIRLVPTDAVGVAREFARYGFRQLHLHDLDAAAGGRRNRAVLQTILFNRSADVQIRGALEDTDDIRDTLALGAHCAIADLRAPNASDWLVEAAGLFEQQVMVAVELQDRRVVAGRTRARSIDVFDFAQELRALPLAGLLVADRDRRRGMAGPDLALVEDIVEECTFGVYWAGGIGSVSHLRALRERGVAGVVIGKAFHTRTLDPFAVAEEFSS
jgi:phosphoribosylformimino-5-aminoimidazole carboxamide ribotide isomerase